MKPLLIIFFLSFSQYLHAEIAIVVHKNSPVMGINEQQASNIFLSKTNRFSNGEKAIPLEIRNNQSKANFYKRISNKTITQLKSYWTTLIFTGKGKPPKSFVNIDYLVNYMKSHTGSIAYVNISEVTPELKVIYSIREE